MIRYLKMKHNEIKVKAMFYEMVLHVINNQKEALYLFQKLYVALKDVSTEELKTEFIKQLAEIVHNKNRDKND